MTKLCVGELILSCYSFDIEYKPGKDNISPDTLSRLVCTTLTSNTLYKVHDALCHPGVVAYVYRILLR